MAGPASVAEYLAGLPDDRRAVVEELRRTINAAAPNATETIAYGMPALRSHGGQFLVSYAAYKKHYSLFPASGAVVAALGEELTQSDEGRAIPALVACLGRVLAPTPDDESRRGA